MTFYRNKEYNFLKKFYERDIVKNLYKDIDRNTSIFIMQIMEALEEYHIKDIQYKARIKTLKEIIKGEIMTNPNKSVWFSGDNKQYVEKQAEKENITFNKKINNLIEADRKKQEEKKEV